MNLVTSRHRCGRAPRTFQPVNLPRPEILKRELSNMGAVYAVVLVLLLLAFAVSLMTDKEPTEPEALPEIIGAPPE